MFCFTWSAVGPRNIQFQPSPQVLLSEDHTCSDVDHEVTLFVKVGTEGRKNAYWVTQDDSIEVDKTDGEGDGRVVMEVEENALVVHLIQGVFIASNRNQLKQYILVS